METHDKSHSGYPEEAPPEVVPDDAKSGDSAAEKSAKPSREARNALDNDDGTATGGHP